MSDNRFENVPVESDTNILHSVEANIEGLPVLFQNWFWDGIYGESIIFDETDVSDKTDDELISLVSGLPVFDTDISNNSVTLSRNKGFVFTNFNFTIVE